MVNENEEEAEQLDVDADVSSLCLLFLIVDFRININKIDHCIVLVDHHYNNHPRFYRLSSLKLSFCLLFLSLIYVLSRIVSFISKTNDIRINEIKYFTFIIIKILIQIF
ncbi:unnamed protein product [Musa textilis]